MGVQLTRAKESCAAGKWPVLVNVRSNVQGTLQSRPGMVPVTGAAFGAPIHTIVRFDDWSEYQQAVGTYNFYFIGAGDTLYSGGVTSGAFAAVDSGWNSVPISWTVLTPPQTPQPWLYMANASRMRKFDSTGQVYQLGINPPTVEPTTELQELGINVIESFFGGFIPWVTAGSATTLIGVISRVNTSVVDFVYDLNTAPGYISIVPDSMDGIDVGVIVDVAGVTMAITQVMIAVADTTIAAIQYDSGSTGMCTIQPAGSLGTGQLQGPSLRDYQARFGVQYAVPRGTAPGGPGTGLPATQDSTAPVTQIRILDFPVNCLVYVGGELVRIHAVAVGADGIQSFRTYTGGSHSAGETIHGVAGFRGWAPVDTFAPGNAINDGALSFSLATTAPVSPATSSQQTGGLRTGAGWPLHDLSQINGRPTLPEDNLFLAIRADNFTLVDTVRVYFSLEPTAGTTPDNNKDFTSNYYFHEWRRSDLASAIQSINTQNVNPITTARQLAQSNAITDGSVTNQPFTVTIQKKSFGVPDVTITPNTDLGQRNSGGGEIFSRNPNAAVTNDAVSQQLALGNDQWLTLRCKIKDLVHVGTDPSKTLANVTASEVIVSMTSAIASTVTIDVDGLWLAGGYELDVGPVGNPYIWCYRYRSSLTGARSNPSPPTRGGVIPQRQWVQVGPTASADPQVDLIDMFRMGGNLSQWTYVGTVPNGSPTFDDTYGDQNVDGGETIDFNLYPPFPIEDIRHTGTCNVSGSSVTWASGDQFNTAWQAGSLITIGNQTYSLYSSPTSPTRLFLNQNAGVQTGAPFVVPGATTIGTITGSIWGGPVGNGATFLFGCANQTDYNKVYWTNGNDSETASDKNTVFVTSGAERLQAGFMWDGTSYVASTDNIYRLEPTFGSASTFTPVVTACGRGFWTPWAWCVAPEGIYFVAKDGIFLTTGGSPAVSITDADLYPLFPHNGVQGQAVNGYFPVAMFPIGNAQTSNATLGCSQDQFSELRLTYIDGWVKFDYMDLGGTRRALCYHVATQAWFPDVTDYPISTRWGGTGERVHQELIGGINGQLYLAGSASDDDRPITCQAQFVDNQGDVRRQKLYRDVFIKGDLSGSTPTVSIGFTDDTVPLTPAVLTGLPGLRSYLVDTVPLTGAFGSNLTVDLTWTPSSPALPEFHAADIAFQPSPELASSWLSGPTTLGSSGYKQIPRALIAYISSAPVTLSVIIDGVTYLYSLPSTGGIFAKEQVVLQSVKGLTFQFGMQGAPFQLFDQDIEVWTQPWGQPSGYQILKPF